MKPKKRLMDGDQKRRESDTRAERDGEETTETRGERDGGEATERRDGERDLHTLRETESEREGEMNENPSLPLSPASGASSSNPQTTT